MKDEIYEKMYRVEERHWWFCAKRTIITNLLRRYLPCSPRQRPLRLADLGCGCGGMLAELPPGIEGEGLDSSRKAVSFCRARGVTARIGSFPSDIPFERESFDAVIMADVIEHIDDDVAAAAAAARLVRPGGVMIVTVPALPALWSSWDAIHGHKRRYTKGSLAAVLSTTGLTAELISYYNTLLFPFAAAARLLAKALGRKTAGELEVPPRPVNSALRLIFAGERHLLGRVPLPVGLSLVAICRKPAA